MGQYHHQQIERKWQEIWKSRQIFRSQVDWTKPKYYVLDMFPYPSGAGLHVGHVTGYTATDIIARYKRQKGFNVLHPMGWDSFGLPAEQYAIRTGTHPKETTEANITTYRRQLQSLGFSYDWSREIATSDPSYYKWTQWIFTKLYERGLAYEGQMVVNYCPALGTVLANEEVENGVSKEGGHPIERRPLRQWVLKITEYAESLLTDLDLLDWPDYLKRLQINWIGRSEGATVHFKEKQTGRQLSVFTTRQDTLFGATFLVISPEHPALDQIVSKEQRSVVENYKAHALAKTDLQRTDLAKEKTGVWTGAYAINPVTDAQIPIWTADYVLMSYGTGAVMGVPAHDERDFAFASQYGLPIVRVVERNGDDLTGDVGCWTGEGVMINSARAGLNLNDLTSAVAKEKVTLFLEKEKLGKKTVTYKLRDWLFSRQRYWGEPFPILHFPDGTKRVLDLEELPLCPPELIDFKPTGSGESPLSRVSDWVHIVDSKTGAKAIRETNTMPQWAGSCWYYLRFCDPHNSEAAWGEESEKYWMPVDLYVGGVEHAVLHLLYARFWHKVLYDCGYVSTKEPFHMLRNQGLVTAFAFKLPQGGYVSPSEIDEREGRFYQMGSGIELEVGNEKMSKSKLNGVTPDEIIEDYGADALRLYEMFMAPFDKEKLWNSDAVNGCRRFLNRFYEMAHSTKVTEEESEEGSRLGHRLIDQVERDISQMQFNTAIAKMMEFINHFTLLENYPKSVIKIVVQLLYPFAPHIAEELWEHLGGKESLTYIPFPQADPKYLIDLVATYVVQVNGKVRGKWELPKDRGEGEILALAKGDPRISKYLEGEIEKVVFVPNKLLSIVVK